MTSGTLFFCDVREKMQSNVENVADLIVDYHVLHVATTSSLDEKDEPVTKEAMIEKHEERQSLVEKVLVVEKDQIDASPKFMRDDIVDGQEILKEKFETKEVVDKENNIIQVEHIDFLGALFTGTVYGHCSSALFTVDAQGHGGGVALLWKNNGGVRVLDSCSNFIDFEVVNESLGRWRYTGYYGYPENDRRVDSWNLLRELAGRSTLPWCIIGDFNGLMVMEEKKGGRSRPRYRLEGFSEAVMDCGLMDLGYTGEKYTWERSRGTDRWIQERLDRGLVNKEWRDLFPDAEVRVLKVSTSDHLPLYLQLNRQVYVPKARRFKFENMWIREKECRNIVQECWSKEGVNDIIDKMLECCAKLEEWGGGMAKEMRTQLANYRKDLRKFRSRRDSEGIQKYNQEKAPGLDGLNPAFFQMYWSIVGGDVIEFCRKFFDTGELPRGVNSTLVCLIPKVKHPKQMMDLRPISLCNVLMRILSKVMANRLKPCLGDIISDKQSAFIEGRLLTDNALVAFEINHYIKRKTQGQKGVAGLKIDVSKAYDRLE
ncbi:uncharacterized protein LOC141719274 [Apium graveolens]|uniref:uncharacterized protein LOC141719274 n=1 Tax=Apium graveolens TaxID=4045 RepID=UPI003D7A1B99